MTQIFLHVGPHKTGTSTIQNWLCANRDVLRAERALYPGQALNHNNVANQLRVGRATPFGSIVDEIRSAPPGTRVILSAEAFTRVPGEDRARLLRDLSAWPVTIIYYLRRSWERAASSHTQGLKNLYRFGPVMGKVERRVGRGDYRDLESWTGYDNCRLSVRVFDKAEWPNGNLIEDFLSVVGLPALGGGPRYVAVPNRNEMPGLPALRVYASVDPTQVEPLGHSAKRQVREHVEVIASQLGWNQPRAVLVSSEDIRRYEAMLAPEYQRIAIDFLGRRDGVLFAPLASDAEFVADSLTADALPVEDRQRFVRAAWDHALDQWEALGLPPLPASLPEHRESRRRSELATVLGLLSRVTGSDDRRGLMAQGLIAKIEADLGWTQREDASIDADPALRPAAVLSAQELLQAGLQAVIVTVLEIERAEQAAQAERAAALAAKPSLRPSPEERELKRAERREIRRALRRAERMQQLQRASGASLRVRAVNVWARIRRVARSVLSRLRRTLRR